jgi:predicted short-subunit dehydrogenase-like oxidoreductase (DUF2520 family)
VSEHLVIVGPGRMGLALGAALAGTGDLDRLTFFGRGLEPPPHPIFDPEPRLGPRGGGAAVAYDEGDDDDVVEEGVTRIDYRTGPNTLPPTATILVLAVPDGALAEVAHDVARAGPAPDGCVALHLAGALSTDVLAPLHAAGYAVGSVHPLQAIADPWAGADRLFGAAYALAGEPAAIAAGRRLANYLAGRTLVVPPAFRAVYHAAAVTASNYLVAVLAAAVRLMGDATIPEDEAVPALLPLLRGTLDNLEQLGVAAALTGPVARGDVETVRLHLGRLSERDRHLYCVLGKETLALARIAGLDEQRAGEIDALLSSD